MSNLAQNIGYGHVMVSVGMDEGETVTQPVIRTVRDYLGRRLRRLINRHRSTQLVQTGARRAISTNVPVLRVDHPTIEGVLHGVWEVADAGDEIGGEFVFRGVSFQ